MWPEGLGLPCPLRLSRVSDLLWLAEPAAGQTPPLSQVSNSGISDKHRNHWEWSRARAAACVRGYMWVACMRPKQGKHPGGFSPVQPKKALFHCQTHLFHCSLIFPDDLSFLFLILYACFFSPFCISYLNYCSSPIGVYKPAWHILTEKLNI